MAFDKLLLDLNSPLGQFYMASPVLTCAKEAKIIEVIRSMNEKQVGSVIITFETSFNQIMAAMRLGKFRHLIIVNKEGHLEGIISIKDVLSRIIDLVNDLKKNS